MNRLARVVAKSNHSVVLELVQAEKCVGCPVNCNKPLIKLFALRKNLLRLSSYDRRYQLINGNKLFSKAQLLNQLVKIEIDAGDLMKSSAILYFLPLVMCLIFLSIGHLVSVYWLLPTDLMALSGLILGLFIFYFFLRKKNIEQHLKFRPKVTILSISGT